MPKSLWINGGITPKKGRASTWRSFWEPSKFSGNFQLQLLGWGNPTNAPFRHLWGDCSRVQHNGDVAYDDPKTMANKTNIMHHKFHRQRNRNRSVGWFPPPPITTQPLSSDNEPKRQRPRPRLPMPMPMLRCKSEMLRDYEILWA